MSLAALINTLLSQSRLSRKRRQLLRFSHLKSEISNLKFPLPAQLPYPKSKI
jgi:hypothetical protein